ISIGQTHGDVTLPGGLTLKSLGKLPWEDYPDYLCSVDLGLSLMYSPHPSHPPIEMAASGVRVITNQFGPKDLSQLSPAILSVPATAPDLADALSVAWHADTVPQQEREINLTKLGLDPELMIDQLAESLANRLPQDQG
ncbi:MAG: glycosyl transferase family 1, partial [Roseovarius sp.]|nr:glycosyl transferase family 1 [Roseovarius sp.]